MEGHLVRKIHVMFRWFSTKRVFLWQDLVVGLRGHIFLSNLCFKSMYDVVIHNASQSLYSGKAGDIAVHTSFGRPVDGQYSFFLQSSHLRSSRARTRQRLP